MQELIGTILDDQYRIEAKIGQGGMAAIFRAYQFSLERHVAIKVLPPSFVAEDPSFVERFQREARAIANLNHPNILPVHDFGVYQDYSYIVMRYVEGGQTLAHLMRHPLSPERAIHLISQIAEALAYAHSRGIIHRDVKPNNILLDNDWALLSDFGLAKISHAATRLTGTGRGIGTAAYMSPEQSQGREIDNRTDIYALGVILYQMLTGKIPHDADNPLTIMMQRVSEPPVRPRELDSSIPEYIEQVILRALAREPDYRYDSATDFGMALKLAAGNGSYQELSSGFQPGQTSVFTTQAFPTTSTETALPPAETAKSRWAVILNNPFWPVVSTLVAVVAVLWGVFFANQGGGPQASSIPGGVAALTSSPTATDTATATATATPTNTPEPASTPTPIATETPVPPPSTSTPTFTLTPTPTATATPTPTPTPTILPPTATPTHTPTPTASAASFDLLSPLDLELPTYGPTIFEWEWHAPLAEDQGFEVRVWREGEPPLGAHDAVADNQASSVESLGQDKYRLEINIKDAAGIEGRGEYFWSVALIRIAPEYVDLGIQAPPARLRFETEFEGGNGTVPIIR